MGYLPYAYYDEQGQAEGPEDRLEDGRRAGAIEPSVETVALGKYNPLSRPLFIYVNKKSAERPEVKPFVEFYLAQRRELSKPCSYSAAGRGLQMAEERFNEMKTGTGFGGKAEFGLPLEEILKREPKR